MLVSISFLSEMESENIATGKSGPALAATCPSAGLHPSAGSQHILPVGLKPSHPKQNKHTLSHTLGISRQILCQRL